MTAQNREFLIILCLLRHIADAEAANVVVAAVRDKNGVEVAQAHRTVVLEHLPLFRVIGRVMIPHKHILLTDFGLDPYLIALSDLCHLDSFMDSAPLFLLISQRTSSSVVSASALIRVVNVPTSDAAASRLLRAPITEEAVVANQLGRLSCIAVVVVVESCDWSVLDALYEHCGRVPTGGATPAAKLATIIVTLERRVGQEVLLERDAQSRGTHTGLSTRVNSGTEG